MSHCQVAVTCFTFRIWQVCMLYRYDNAKPVNSCFRLAGQRTARTQATYFWIDLLQFVAVYIMYISPMLLPLLFNNPHYGRMCVL